MIYQIFITAGRPTERCRCSAHVPEGVRLLTELQSLPPKTTIRSDICIIGGGIMGLALAREFVSTPFSVVVLEGGGEAIDRENQELFKLESRGERMLNPPHVARTMAIGGSSHCWGGWNRPFVEKITREWPVTHEELNGYHQRVNEILDLHSGDLSNPAGWVATDDGWYPDYGPGIITGLRQIRPVNMWQKHTAALSAAPHIQVITNAYLTRMVMHPERERLSRVEVRGKDGRTQRVESTFFILASGGIENAIILLNGNADNQNRLGNRFDNVGRYFMDHAEIIDGTLLEQRCLSPYFRYGGAKGHIGRDVRYVQQFYSLDTSLPEYSDLPNHAVGVWNYDKMCEHRNHREFQRDGESTRFLNQLGVYLQHAPQPYRESRITLSEGRNRHGVRTGVMDWRIPPGDLERVKKVARALELRFGLNQLGRLRLSERLDNHGFQMPGGGIFNGRHFMGATRMSLTAQDGVVNPDLRVFGTENVFITGASTFPSYGWSGPTYTAMALNLRLADHLKELSGRVGIESQRA